VGVTHKVEIARQDAAPGSSGGVSFGRDTLPVGTVTLPRTTVAEPLTERLHRCAEGIVETKC
jgi:hypothetical protein